MLSTNRRFQFLRKDELLIGERGRRHAGQSFKFGDEVRLIVIVGVGGYFRPIERRVLSRHFDDLLKAQDADKLLRTDADGILKSAVEMTIAHAEPLRQVADASHSRLLR